MSGSQKRVSRWSPHEHSRLRPRLFSAACVLFLVNVAQAGSPDVDRGRYLVEALTACDNCHTPRASDGYDLSKRFSGGSQVFADKDYSVRGSNISPDVESGVGAWTDAELRAAITKGTGPKGHLAPVMPSESYGALTRKDLDALIAFLRSSSPVKSGPTQQERKGTPEPRRALPGAEDAFSDDALADSVRRGLYVASLARCMSCHSSEVDGAPDPANHLGQGGKIFRTPSGVAVASNITSDVESGIGAWSDDEIKRAIRHGVSREGKPLAPTMANLSRAHFSKMSEEDLNALIAWLRKVPPAK